MRLYRAEKTILLIVAGLGIATLALIGLKDITVDYTKFQLPLFVGLAALASGQFFRSVLHRERIALAATIFGLSVLDALVFSTYNILLLPRPMAPIDPLLVRIDAWFGYSWPEFCAWAAQYAGLPGFLSAFYLQSVNILMAAYLCLSVFGDRRRMHIMAYACIFASLITISFWAAIPSTGASAYWTLAPEIEAIVQPLASSANGQELNRLVAEGVRDISELNVGGLIGFPSYHTVMSFVIVLAVWPYLPLRLISIALTVVAVPAILIHGGHNLVDVFGGVAVTVVSWWIAVRVYDAQEATKPTQEEEPASGSGALA